MDEPFYALQCVTLHYSDSGGLCATKQRFLMRKIK